jgi:hypothetical protein
MKKRELCHEEGAGGRELGHGGEAGAGPLRGRSWWAGAAGWLAGAGVGSWAMMDGEGAGRSSKHLYIVKCLK